MGLYIKKNGALVQVAVSNKAIKSEGEKTVALDMSNGDQIVEPSGQIQVFTKVTVQKPDTMVPGNIKKDVVIGGVTGTYQAEDMLPYRISDKGSYSVIDNSITSVKKYAFYYDSQLTSFSSTSLTTLSTYSFYRCDNLTTVNIPSVTIISDYAFGYSGLTSFDFTNVTEIKNGAFQNCASLTSISLPNTITTLPNAAFSSCSNLQNVYVPNVATLGGNDFAYSKITEVTDAMFPNTTRTGYASFQNCSSLTTVNNTKLTYLSQSVFGYCANLVTVNLPNVTYSGGFCFDNDTSLTTLSLPEMTEISGNGICRDCSSLVSVYFPKASTWLGNDHFSGCTSLQIVDMGTRNKIQYSSFSSSVHSVTDIYLRKTGSVCTLSGTSTSFIPYYNQTINIHVPSDLIASYQTASNWVTLYNDGKVTFVAIS